MAALLGSSEENPPLTLQINFESLVNILEIARIFDIERIVYISSSAVYAGVIGEHGPPTYKPINEDYEFISPKLDPKGLRLYAITKLASELYGLYYAKTYGIDFVALRFSQPYGPEKVRRPTGSQIFTWMIENAMLRKPTKIQDELIKKDWIYRKDIAKGIVLASYAKQLKHRLFHLGSGKGITLLDLANAIKKVIPKAVIEIKQGPNQYNYGRHWVFDTSRAREELKFTPDYNLEESIKDYIETMRRLNISPVYTPLE
jgi:nucleoside-diphosphate-sugar epimerase